MHVVSLGTYAPPATYGQMGPEGLPGATWAGLPALAGWLDRLREAREEARLSPREKAKRQAARVAQQRGYLIPTRGQVRGIAAQKFADRTRVFQALTAGQKAKAKSILGPAAIAGSFFIPGVGPLIGMSLIGRKLVQRRRAKRAVTGLFFWDWQKNEEQQKKEEIDEGPEVPLSNRMAKD